jgi:thiamine-phosphate pyrophosphorylase
MVNRLQYISQGVTALTQIENIQSALDVGCTWIQLRFKNSNDKEFVKTAEHIRALCSVYEATFIVNDHVSIANAVDADGVHLGLDDMTVAEARLVLGEGKIIGGTANTLLHVLKRVEERCDYIGLGPFRFTNTKEKLSPILGLRGYELIMHELIKRKIAIPVYAIGGITKHDIESILNTGVYGVAVSGAITNEAGSKVWIDKLRSLVKDEKVNYSR